MHGSRTSRRQRLATALGIALVLSATGTSASANKVSDKDPLSGGVKDAGTLSAVMRVGKTRTGCANDGTSAVGGGGLGLLTQGRKNAYYEFGNTLGDPNAVTSVFNGHVGYFKICGRLDKEFSNVAGGFGAACDAAKGWEGKGTITYPANPGKPTIWLSHLG